jgi:hypothetical protein
MIAVLICVASLAALLHFFISYARSLVATYRRVEVSERVRTLAEAQSSDVSADEFARSDDRFEIQAVGAYYDLVTVCETFFKSIPGALRRLEQERVGCSHFAAVALERRIEYSRSLLEHGAGVS